jgi:OmpA-OmpF porin, OOP family
MRKLATPLFTLFGTAVLLSASWTAVAAEPGLYFGATAGVASIKQDELDEDDPSFWKAYVGTQVNPWLGVEASWIEFAKSEQDDVDLQSNGFSAAALLSLPLGEASSIYAKAGQFWWDADATVGGVGVSNDGNDTFWGAGFLLGLTDNLHVRLEFERYKLDDIDIDGASAGLQLTF